MTDDKLTGKEKEIDKNLQIYLTAPPDAFAAVCQKFVAAYFFRAMTFDFTMHNMEEYT
ncbi:MAG: hypothetical protein FWB82_05610 [Treponema sp.]|nr:hypothetical protein [Treponema sp.]